MAALSRRVPDQVRVSIQQYSDGGVDALAHVKYLQLGVFGQSQSDLLIQNQLIERI